MIYSPFHGTHAMTRLCTIMAPASSVTSSVTSQNQCIWRNKGVSRTECSSEECSIGWNNHTEKCILKKISSFAFQEVACCSLLENNETLHSHTDTPGVSLGPRRQRFGACLVDYCRQQLRKSGHYGAVFVGCRNRVYESESIDVNIWHEFRWLSDQALKMSVFSTLGTKEPRIGF